MEEDPCVGKVSEDPSLLLQVIILTTLDIEGEGREEGDQERSFASLCEIRMDTSTGSIVQQCCLE